MSTQDMSSQESRSVQVSISGGIEQTAKERVERALKDTIEKELSVTPLARKQPHDRITFSQSR